MKIKEKKVKKYDVEMTEEELIALFRMVDCTLQKELFHPTTKYKKILRGMYKKSGKYFF